MDWDKQQKLETSTRIGKQVWLNVKGGWTPTLWGTVDDEVSILGDVVKHGGIGLRVREIRFHRTDRQSELSADSIEPLVVPAMLRHFRLAQVHLEEVDLRRDHAEDFAGVERIASELEGRGRGPRAS